MPRFAAFISAIGSLDYSSPADDDFPRANAATDRPGQTFCHPTDPVAYPRGGQFDFSSANYWIDTSAGSVSISAGNRTIPEVCADLTAALQTLDATFSVGYQSASRKFVISRSTAFSILWASGAHAASSMGSELGWTTSADTSSTTIQVADKVRVATHSWLAFQATAATAAHLAALILGDDDDADYSDVVLYAMTSLPSPQTRAKFASFASASYSFSARSTKPDAALQVATPAGASTTAWWVISWRHIDEALLHRVGLARVYSAPVTSSTRTVRALRGHGLSDGTESLGPANYWPVRQEQAWQTRLDFDSWPASDWRTVGHAIARRGPARPIAWSLNWHSIVAATVTAADEIEKGYLQFAALAGAPSDDYQGQGSDYISASLDFVQVR